MQSFTLRDSTGRFTRKAFYLPAEGAPGRIAVFLDAEYYVDQMETPSLLGSLQQDGAIPAVASLFISNQSAEARHHDYTCGDPFADFIAKDVIPWMRRQSGVQAAGNHLIAGLSLSGLQSAYTSLCYPDTFGAALCQSGSFWWEDEWLLKHLRELHPNPGRYWLSVGTREQGAGLVHPPTDLHQNVDQDAAIRNFSEALAKQGSRVHDHLFEGGHATVHWKEELPAALRWLLES